MGKHSFETADLLQTFLDLPEEEFIIAVTHDIRHCCTAILAFGELIQMGMDGGEMDTPQLVENYLAIVPNRITDMTHVLDAAVEYDRIQKGKQNKSATNGSLAVVSNESVDDSKDLWLKEPDQFIPTLTNYVRNRCPKVLAEIEAMRHAKPETLMNHLSALIEVARDIVDITTVAVEYDESQNGKHYS